VKALRGTVVSGAGEGAIFVALGWFRAAVHAAAGFDPYAGTLNVRLVDAEALATWRALRDGAAVAVAPPEPGGCGGRLVPVRIGEVAAAVVVPDVTRYGDDTLEVVAATHLRARLGLRDGDLVVLRYDDDATPRAEREQGGRA
jgi:riboflavin kinase